jgi:hypothetical protein
VWSIGAVVLCVAVWAGEPAAEAGNNAVMLFPVVKDGRWGYMDDKGEVKIEPQYDQAFDFSDGRACVVKYPWRGYIDGAGKIVVEPQFTWAGPFREGLAPVLSHWRFYGRHANYYGGTAGHAKDAGVEDKMRSGFIDTSGKPREGLPLSTSGVSDGKVVLWSKKGSTVYGIDGKKCEHDADEVCQFSDGMGPARKGAKWGYLDHSMKWAIDPQFDEADGFSEGFAAVGTSDIPPPEKANNKSMSAWREKRKVSWGFIDKTGTVVIEQKFEDCWRFSEGLASVKVDGKWGYIDTRGSVVIEPKYDYAWPFSEGMGRVMVGEEQGFVDTKGTVAVKPQYRPAWEFSKGLARVQLKDDDGSFREGYIDKKGEYVWEPAK